MHRLTERQRIEILMMIGYGENIRSQSEVVNLFNTKYPETQVTQSCVSKIFSKFEEHGSVRDLPKTGRPKISEDDQLDTLLQVQDNHTIATRQIASNLAISQRSVLRILKKKQIPSL